MLNKCETIVRLDKQVDDEQLEVGEVFNVCYACCCAWIQYGCSKTPDEMKKLERTREWNDEDTDLYWDAVQKIGDPAGMWFEPSFKLIAGNQAQVKVYSLYLSGHQGIALAIYQSKVLQAFPPRKSAERYWCYIFDSNYGIVHIAMTGQDNFVAKTRQVITELVSKVIVVQKSDELSKLGYSDITAHANISIKTYGKRI